MNKCYVIAEGGVNHNGHINLAKEMVKVAKEAGADAIKFQLFKAETLTTKSAQQADYQQKNCKVSMSQYDMLKSLELSYEAFDELNQVAQEFEIDFMMTPFDLDSFHFLANELKLNVIKIGSGDITFGPMLLLAGRSGCDIILSTGMSSLDDVEHALKVIAFGGIEKSLYPTKQSLDAIYETPQAKEFLKNKVTLLHCLSEYPAPYHDMNLRAMDTMAKAFDLKIGLSDHSQGIVIPTAAAAMGAAVIEKHFTLSKDLAGPDHLASLDPHELYEMVKAIRIVETALGDGEKSIKNSEMKNRSLVRRSLVAKRPIQEGELFTLENIAIKRPEGGMSPMQVWDLINQKSSRSYDIDEVLV